MKLIILILIMLLSLSCKAQTGYFGKSDKDTLRAYPFYSGRRERTAIYELPKQSDTIKWPGWQEGIIFFDKTYRFEFTEEAVMTFYKTAPEIITELIKADAKKNAYLIVGISALYNEMKRQIDTTHK